MTEAVNGVALEDLVRSVVAGGAAIREIQGRYDDVGWRIQEPTWAKARHLLYHLLAATTELALLVEEVEHGEERGDVVSSEEFNALVAKHPSICATLVFHAAQLANMADLDLGAELSRMYHRNAQRFAPETPFASLDVEGL